MKTAKLRALLENLCACCLLHRYDLVLCSYALSDLPDADSGREKLVRQLWGKFSVPMATDDSN